MVALADRRMTADEFFDWVERQELPYELVDGLPVLLVRSPEREGPSAMAGASPRHALIASNLALALGGATTGGPCEVYQSDAGIRIDDDQVRYPDITVDCSDEVPTWGSLPEPMIVVEVLSHSTRRFDVREKLAEYKRVPSVVAIVLIEQEFAEVEAHYRVVDDAWRTVRHINVADVLALPSIEAEIPLHVIYRRAPIGERPRPRPYLAATE